jgi:hypothetical protein
LHAVGHTVGYRRQPGSNPILGSPPASLTALSDLLDALRAGGDLDIVREALGLVLQALIDAEATQHIGASRYERTEARSAHRNGTRSRLLSTKAGDVELKISKLREGAFFPSLLEPRRRWAAPGTTPAPDRIGPASTRAAGCLAR